MRTFFSLNDYPWLAINHTILHQWISLNRMVADRKCGNALFRSNDFGKISMLIIAHMNRLSMSPTKKIFCSCMTSGSAINDLTSGGRGVLDLGLYGTTWDYMGLPGTIDLKLRWEMRTKAVESKRRKMIQFLVSFIKYLNYKNIG